MAAIDTTMRVDSPDISQMMSLQASPLLNVEAPVFSPVGLPKPGKQVDEFWSSREVCNFRSDVPIDSSLFHLVLTEYSGITQSFTPTIRRSDSAFGGPASYLEWLTGRIDDAGHSAIATACKPSF